MIENNPTNVVAAFEMLLCPKLLAILATDDKFIEEDKIPQVS